MAAAPRARPGQAANSKDLAKAFGDKPEADIVLEILAKGQLQVSKEERERANEQQFTEVARMVTERCVNPDTQRPYTMAQIERAMKDIHVSIKPNQPLKKQALEVMAQLKESIPIDRAQMRLRIALPQSCNPKAIKASEHTRVHARFHAARSRPQRRAPQATFATLACACLWPPRVGAEAACRAPTRF